MGNCCTSSRHEACWAAWVTLGDVNFSRQRGAHIIVPEATAKQFSFRLPGKLVRRIERCMAGLKAAGLDVNRADVVRLLLTQALDATRCNPRLLFGTLERGSDHRSAKSG